MNAEIEMQIEKLFREAEQIKRREENAKDLKIKWEKFLKEHKNAKQKEPKEMP